MIGMHVRHTDACWVAVEVDLHQDEDAVQETGRATDGYTCNHFDDYMKDAELIREKYGIDTIFLATGTAC